MRFRVHVGRDLPTRRHCSDAAQARACGASLRGGQMKPRCCARSGQPSDPAASSSTSGSSRADQSKRHDRFRWTSPPPAVRHRHAAHHGRDGHARGHGQEGLEDAASVRRDRSRCRSRTSSAAKRTSSEAEGAAIILTAGILDNGRTSRSGTSSEVRAKLSNGQVAVRDIRSARDREADGTFRAKSHRARATRTSVARRTRPRHLIVALMLATYWRLGSGQPRYLPVRGPRHLARRLVDPTDAHAA